MIKFLSVVMAMMLTSVCAAAVKTERIEYKVGNDTFEGVLAYDDAVKETRPGVLVCHEWWGNNEYAAFRASQLAELGYVAFALDMYGKGKVTTDPNQAGAWAGEATGDLKVLRERASAGLKILAENAKVDKSRLAAIGYCMGGTVALELARSGLAHTSNLKAIVAFHASTIAARTADDNRNIKGTILICHGQVDTFVQPKQISEFHMQMQDAEVDYVFVSYAGAVHAFSNPKADSYGVDGVRYNEKADKRSWSQMQDLFRERFAK